MLFYVVMFFIPLMTSISTLINAHDTELLHFKGVTSEEVCKLDMSLLKIVDGNFMNADRMESLFYMLNRITDIVHGKKQVTGERVGLLHFGKQKVDLVTLAQYEQTEDFNEQERQYLQQALHEGKKLFMDVSKPLSSQVRGMKMIFIHLIEDSLNKHGRNGHSLLLGWANAESTEDEVISFDRDITSCQQLLSFLTDLSNFLTDMVHSCPIAWKQFKERVEKLSKIKQLLPEAIARTKIKISVETFIAYVRQKHLEKIYLEDITVDLVCALITSSVR